MGTDSSTAAVIDRAPRPLVARVRGAWGWLAARPALLCVALALIAALSLARQWDGRILWDPDSLMYQAQTLELRGEDVHSARQELFLGPLGAWARSLEARRPAAQRKYGDPRWIDYASQFYRRRWLLPALAAASYPALGQRSLMTWSLLGYVAIAPLLFLLLRRRFGAGTSFVVALACLALGPLRDWSVIPMTDSWGVALLIAALLAALAVCERGPRWLPAWIVAVLALSITRDTAFVAVAAAVVLALAQRTRRNAALAGTGLLALLPAPLLFGGGGRDELAYAVNGRTIPHDDSWGFIAGHYGQTVHDMLTSYASYATGSPLVVLAFAAGLVLLYALGARRVRGGRGRGGADPLMLLLFGLPLGYLALLVIGPTFSRFRYELVLLPCVAAGFALAIDEVRRRITIRPRWLTSATSG